MDQKDIDSLTGKLKSSASQKALIKGIDTVRSDYAHVIEYLKQSEQKQKRRDKISTIISILAMLFSGVAAFAAILQLLH